VARTALRNRGQLRAALAADGRSPLVVVHGDTFTTPYGALLGRRLGARVAHLEAGMRTRNLLNPFPEEINRRIATRLADIHFAPTAREVENLRGARGVVVDTGANTVIDAMRQAVGAATDDDLPAEFGVATLHRFELLQRPEKFREVLELLRRVATAPRSCTSPARRSGSGSSGTAFAACSTTGVSCCAPSAGTYRSSRCSPGPGSW
jgi:UDP-N-acetylglucosamine 2-epimerase (non-hydrolysing)